MDPGGHKIYFMKKGAGRKVLSSPRGWMQVTDSPPPGLVLPSSRVQADSSRVGKFSQEQQRPLLQLPRVPGETPTYPSTGDWGYHNRTICVTTVWLDPETMAPSPARSFHGKTGPRSGRPSPHTLVIKPFSNLGWFKLEKSDLSPLCRVDGGDTRRCCLLVVNARRYARAFTAAAALGHSGRS